MPEKDQDKLIQDILKNQEFYREDDKLIQVMPNGDTYEIDFGNNDNPIDLPAQEVEQDTKEGYNKSSNTREPPNNKNINDTEMENIEQTQDLTKKQYREHYWRENEHFKEDGSTLMMETRISKCQEATGKSREECSKEVKAEMKKKGSENTNTEDLVEDQKKKEEKPEEEEEEEEEKKDMEKESEKEDAICPEKIKDMEEVDWKKEYQTLKKDVLEFKEILDKKDAKKRQKKIDKKLESFTSDFILPDEPVKEILDFIPVEKQLEFLPKLHILGDLIAKKEPTSKVTYNEEDFKTDIEKQREKIYSGLRTV